jgi:putative salt-induced outer membrane protein YdiY
MRICPVRSGPGLLLAFLAAVPPLAGDRLEVQGGAVLTGEIESVTEDWIRMRTDYAGELTVDLKKVTSLVSEQEFLLPREEDEVRGRLRVEGSGADWFLVTEERELQISLTEALLLQPVATGEAGEKGSAETAETAPGDKVTAPAPQRGVMETERAQPTIAEAGPLFFLDRLFPPPPEGWSLESGFNLTGKSGNTERFDIGVTLDAQYERDFDRLDLYGRYNYGTNRSRRTSDEIVVGGRYTNFIFDRLGFFVRQEVERDQFEDLGLRSTSAVGVSYRLRNEEDLRLEFRGGVSYRFENYENDGGEEIPGMDFGLDVLWKFSPWARFKGNYTFLPSIDRQEDFIIEQDSGLNLPLGMSDRWKLRFGINSQYNNEPEPGRKNLDWRYYARLIASWE